MMRRIAASAVNLLPKGPSGFLSVAELEGSKSSVIRCLLSSEAGGGRFQKTSTGLVGLAVDQNGVENLLNANKAILEKIRDVPETSQFRINVEQVSNYRIKVIEENPEDADLIEEMIDCGQIEELVEQAKDELGLIDVYVRERVWDSIEQRDQEANLVYDSAKSS
eukprot:CAMPEP_0194272992 /NCGR_PEP_ID=MMETSP0169-20130528/6425_1 /TAXON_ID=218684 /ORGANISM="Corethron pennatum, Strain L29A3" /LENGTH=164 /DNA_ID=CAMNT_0039015803 /DNA_START=44 /DNA_END=538 /DNA_ORIENTATION=-